MPPLYDLYNLIEFGAGALTAAGLATGLAAWTRRRTRRRTAANIRRAIAAYIDTTCREPGREPGHPAYRLYTSRPDLEGICDWYGKVDTMPPPGTSPGRAARLYGAPPEVDTLTRLHRTHRIAAARVTAALDGKTRNSPVRRLPDRAAAVQRFEATTVPLNGD